MSWADTVNTNPFKNAQISPFTDTEDLSVTTWVMQKLQHSMCSSQDNIHDITDCGKKIGYVSWDLQKKSDCLADGILTGQRTLETFILGMINKHPMVQNSSPRSPIKAVK